MPFDLAADTTKLCRVCMTAKEGHRTDLYDAASFVSGQPSLYGMLKAVCAPVFAKSDDGNRPLGMPTKVCAVCRNATIAAFKLHQMCIDTERRLGELLVLKRELMEGLVGDDVENDDEVGDPLQNNKEASQERPSIPEEIPSEETKSQELQESNENTKDSRQNGENEETIKVEELNLVDDLVDDSCEDENEDFDTFEHQVPASADGKAKRICQICNETFNKAYLLMSHMTQKHQLYMCELCLETFGSLSWLIKHKAMRHKRRKVSECTICKETFPTRGAMFKHRITHVSTHKCSICGATNFSKAKLKLHMRRHMGDKQFACDSCPMRFYTKIELTLHTQTHTKIKNAICDICGSRFTRKESLKLHVQRVHDGYRPHECSLCGLKFSLRYQLKRHMYTHTGEKPYKCQLCPQSYAQTNDLVKHMARAHGLDKPYQCDRCDEGFRLMTDLRQHYRVHMQSTEGGAEQMEEVRFTTVALLRKAFAKDAKQPTEG
uniref:C2h2-type zn-finger protein n=1 Tax=Culex tarsalis TaxID=7177 RepID=A0A1Q3F481_CULTA